MNLEKEFIVKTAVTNGLESFVIETNDDDQSLNCEREANALSIELGLEIYYSADKTVVFDNPHQSTWTFKGHHTIEDIEEDFKSYEL